VNWALRLTTEQQRGLVEASHLVPGCSTSAGVARYAIDKFLADLFSDRQTIES